MLQLAVTIGMGDAISIGVVALLASGLGAAVKLAGLVSGLIRDLEKAEGRITDLERHDTGATAAQQLRATPWLSRS